MKYKAQRTNVAYYEEIALKNAALITKIADLQFSNGDINYLEWTQLINQNISIQSNYADAIYNLNTTIIQLNYLTNP
jgi:cobalt-zinc-cadmium resistance protein CzcA